MVYDEDNKVERIVASVVDQYFVLHAHHNQHTLLTREQIVALVREIESQVGNASPEEQLESEQRVTEALAAHRWGVPPSAWNRSGLPTLATIGQGILLNPFEYLCILLRRLTSVCDVLLVFVHDVIHESFDFTPFVSSHSIDQWRAFFFPTTQIRIRPCSAAPRQTLANTNYMSVSTVCTVCTYKHSQTLMNYKHSQTRIQHYPSGEFTSDSEH